jgi:hypothetical protein
MVLLCSAGAGDAGYFMMHAKLFSPIPVIGSVDDQVKRRYFSSLAGSWVPVARACHPKLRGAELTQTQVGGIFHGRVGRQQWGVNLALGPS